MLCTFVYIQRKVQLENVEREKRGPEIEKVVVVLLLLLLHTAQYRLKQNDKEARTKNQLLTTQLSLSNVGSNECCKRFSIIRIRQYKENVKKNAIVQEQNASKESRRLVVRVSRQQTE